MPVAGCRHKYKQPTPELFQTAERKYLRDEVRKESVAMCFHCLLCMHVLVWAMSVIGSQLMQMPIWLPSSGNMYIRLYGLWVCCKLGRVLFTCSPPISTYALCSVGNPLQLR